MPEPYWIFPMSLAPNDLILLRDRAARYLSTFIDPKTTDPLARTLALRPRPEDFARVFVEGTAAAAQDAYDRLWSNITPITGKPNQSVVLAWICLSNAFTTPDGKRFPGGYQKILDRLQPDIAWVCWKFAAPGQVHGMAYDGLVSLDDRWVWFPKPWKLIAASVGALDYLTD